MECHMARPHGSVDDMDEYLCVLRNIPPHQHYLLKNIPFDMNGIY
jgi:hypothetical protein